MMKENEKLVRYLETIVDLEKKKLTQQMIIEKLNFNISKCDNPQLKRYQEMPSKPSAEYSIPLLVLYIIGLTILLKIVLNLPIISHISLITGAAVIFYIISVFGLIMICKEHHDDVDDFHNQCNSTAIENYKIEKENNRIISVNKSKASKLRKDAALVNSSLSETSFSLRKWYAMGILHPKYQNVVAVCSILEYFQTGVCTELIGHEGAYNKFDVEILLKTGIYKLDDVLTHLEQIKQNQQLLYYAIMGCNRNASELLNKVLSSNEKIVEVVNKQGQTVSAHLSAVEYTGNVIADLEMFNLLRTRK